MRFNPVTIKREADYRYQNAVRSFRKPIPNTRFVIGQRIYCDPLGEDGHIVGYEHDGFILIIDLVQGDTAHVPAADCEAR